MNKLILSLYSDGKTTREVALVVGKSKSRVAEIVKKAGVSRPRDVRPTVLANRAKTCPKFTCEFVSYLDGLLISDGSLARPSKNTLTSCYTHDSKTSEWLRVIHDEFVSFGIKCSVKLRKRRNEHQLRSYRYDRFYEQYVRWYPDLKEKRVPRDIDLSSKLLLRNWIYGDGTLGNDFRFCTDSFHVEDIEFLIGCFDDLDFGFRKIYMGKSKLGFPKYRLSICQSTGQQRFFEYVGEPDVEEFAYKWPRRAE